MRRVARLASTLLLVTGCGTAAVPEATQPTDGVQDALTTTERGLLGSSTRLWRTSGALERCGQWTKAEDYSSGRYNVHRYAIDVFAGGEVRLSLAPTAGQMQPALLIASRDGAWALGPAGQSSVDGITATRETSGRLGAQEQVVLRATSDRALDVYVTGWREVDSGFTKMLGRDVKYSLQLNHACATEVPTGDWRAVHDGLGQGGGSVPRAGLANPTLQSTLGIGVEPLGEVVDVNGAAFVAGRLSHFGGPADTGVGPTETGAITGEIVRTLNDPLDPDAAALEARPEDYYYVAMRFDYTNVGRDFWAQARLLVAAPETGRAVVVRPADWGPHTRTGRIVDLSPQAVVDLGLETDDLALVSFAAAGTPLGVVRAAEAPAPEEPAPEEPAPEEPPPEEPPADLCPQGVVCADSLPVVHAGDTRASTWDRLDGYSCAPDVNESGPEVIYRIDVEQVGLLTAAIAEDAPGDVDVDLHILSDLDPSACLDRGHWRAARLVAPGRYWVVVDSWVGSDGTAYAGRYDLRIDLTTAHTFEPSGLSARVMQDALHAFDVAWQEDRVERLRYTVIDFSLRSTEPRMWVLDLSENRVRHRLHTAHGRNSQNPSDPAVSDRFSNENGSNRSSLGVAVTAETYSGAHGLSLRLEGLEPGYNDNMRARAIVVHGASYARPEVADSQGYLGRSLGCPAVDDREAAQLITDIAQGTLMMSWYPDGDWSARSRYLP